MADTFLLDTVYLCLCLPPSQAVPSPSFVFLLPRRYHLHHLSSSFPGGTISIICLPPSQAVPSPSFVFFLPRRYHLHHLSSSFPGGIISIICHPPSQAVPSPSFVFLLPRWYHLHHLSSAFPGGTISIICLLPSQTVPSPSFVFRHSLGLFSSSVQTAPVSLSPASLLCSRNSQLQFIFCKSLEYFVSNCNQINETSV